MDRNLEHIEQARQILQERLDRLKTTEERNRCGQYATPFMFAQEIVEQTAQYLPNIDKITFLDPAFGTGAFYSALLSVFPEDIIQKSRGIEIDPHYALPTRELWKAFPIQLTTDDFTRLSAPESEAEKYNVVICNPPYVRHHHLPKEKKEQLQQFIKYHWRYTLSGLAGFYCYFLLFADLWLKEDGIGCWLIPNEFLDVNYGKTIKQYLTRNVTLLRIHKFYSNDVKFDDALVTSVVVWFKKAPPCSGHEAIFSSGKNLQKPEYTRCLAVEQLQPTEKWTTYFQSEITLSETAPVVGDFFTIKRGVATGDNSFFILEESKIHAEELPIQFFSPILPSPRYLKSDRIDSFQDGTPNIEKRLFLLNCRLPEETIQQEYPSLWMYLSKGIGTVSERYICRHRTPWYRQEHREPAPFLCTYMGRNQKPFRFILNNSQAIAANVYLYLYPKPVLQRLIEQDSTVAESIWELLNNIDIQLFIQNGRVYGGGLHKLEPKELQSIPIPEICSIEPSLHIVKVKQGVLF